MTILNDLSMPIIIFDLEDFNINKSNMISHYNKLIDKLIDDEYLWRQNQIDYIIKHTEKNKLDRYDSNFWNNFYVNGLQNKEKEELLYLLPPKKREKFLRLKPYRRRVAINFLLSLEKNVWKFLKIKHKSFKQEKANIKDDAQDLRLNERIFPEGGDNFLTPDLIHLLQSVVKKIQSYNSSIKCLEGVVHFTLVNSLEEQCTTNSPEGIHQDGMDYIISALVLERHNIEGGKSIIYAGDKKTKLLEVTLKAGQGILQVDMNSELWHTVTPISKQATGTPGYRFTIGVDLKVLD